ncbi:MAG TPA: RluA family pseudouridine synthase [Firmicutes bacterium]|nr:RluA family pseudouridine synthase [Bacillota bacterium]
MDVYKDNQYLLFQINEEVAGQSIRDFLSSFHLSRKKIHELYMAKTVKLNGEAVSFETILGKYDILGVPVFEEEGLDFIPQKMKLEIVYEDDHLLILNKPAGVMVHPDQKNGKNTLVNGVAHYYKEKGYHMQIRYIHRLDTDTSGGIIFAKHYLAHSLMDNWLSEKNITRRYLALVHGTLKVPKGIINEPIGKDRHHNARRRVAKNGDVALTHYQVVKSFKNYSLVSLELKTGRTHQIRVHMAHLGHPLLGDTLYGGTLPFKHLKRQALHSAQIKMKHPITGETLELEIPLPRDMKELT